MAKDFIDRAHVIIIESPSPKDILRNHREGGALAKMLDLAGVKSDYYEVVNGEMFDLGMDMAIDAIRVWGLAEHKEGAPEGKLLVVFHFAAHGGENGIVLTSDEEVTWHAMGQELLNAGNELKRNRCGDGPACLFLVCLSVCGGFRAKQMADGLDTCPFINLVGSDLDVNWSDSLTAFMALYQNVIVKGKPIPNAVVDMNAAAGVPDLFKTVSYADLGFRKG